MQRSAEGMATGRVAVKPGREKPIRNGHPWVYSGAVERVDGQPQDGEVVDVVTESGDFLACGLLNRQSQIVVRLFSWTPGTLLDQHVLQERIAAAQARREGLLPPETDAYRVVFSEADSLPGLIVDRYGEVLVVQCSTLGMQRRKELIVAILQDLFAPTAIIERADTDALAREGLNVASSVLAGRLAEHTTISEDRLRFTVDLLGGQKTGFYLDQRDNRWRVGLYCRGARVLNCFAYTGAFGVYAARAGADQVIHVDTSTEALRVAEAHQQLNGFERPQDEYLAGDVFQVLRHYREQGERFDVIILDPPKFAANVEQVQRATRGYKDINLLALQLLRPNGFLATFSCSGVVNADLFQKVVFGASVDAHRPAQIIERLTQAPDHPVLLAFPESEYLKGLICRAV